MSKLTLSQVARIAHETNRAYCAELGDMSQVPWEEAPEWQRQSAVTGVAYHFSHPQSQPCDSHNSWLEEKRRTGWTYGTVKDPVKKEHPCFVPYEALPEEQQIKDALFVGVVRALERMTVGGPVTEA